jgi:hypothetical protein
MLSDLSRNLTASIYVLIAAITFRSEMVGERSITTNGVRSIEQIGPTRDRTVSHETNTIW